MSVAAGPLLMETVCHNGIVRNTLQTKALTGNALEARDRLSVSRVSRGDYMPV